MASVLRSNALATRPLPRALGRKGVFASGPSAPRPVGLRSLRPLQRVGALDDGAPQREPQAESSKPAASPSQPESPQMQDSTTNLLSSLVLAAVYMGIMAYVWVLSPDQTPARDAYFVDKLLSQVEDSYQLPAVFWSVFNIMAVYPPLFAFLIVPTGRSENKVPAWPFLAVSQFLGMYALFPYFIFWQPQSNPPQPKELSPAQTAFSTVVPALLLLAGGGLWANALLAGPEEWAQFSRLLDESRLVHATTLDFCMCTVVAPFWMYHDAQVRGWEQRDKAIPILSCLPVVGPAVYLLLRPKNY